MEEIWKNIQDYENKYQVSNLGNVKDIVKNKLLNKQDNGKGYLTVALYKNKKSTKRYIHRLVIINFIGENNKRKFVNHKDGNKKNNCLDNLEWVTSSENMIHAVKNNLIHYHKGFDNKNSYGVVQMDKKGNVIKIFGSLKEVSDYEKVFKRSIENVCNGKKVTYKEKRYMYLKDYNNKEEYHKRLLRKPKAEKIYCLNNNKTYESITKAGNELKLNRNKIPDVCNNKRKNLKGYYFKWIE